MVNRRPIKLSIAVVVRGYQRGDDVDHKGK
jgi:hypothetical protein